VINIARKIFITGTKIPLLPIEMPEKALKNIPKDIISEKMKNF
jgi:hypothetical protein